MENESEKIVDLSIEDDIDEESKDIADTEMETKIYNVTARDDGVTWGM